MSVCQKSGRLARELPALDVEDARGVGERLAAVLLVVDRDSLSPLLAAVVVEGGELLEVLVCRGLRDPPVEPDELRLVLVDELGGTREPVVEELLARRGLPLLGPLAVGGGGIEAGVAGIPDVGIELHALSKEPPMLDAVRGEAEDQPFGPRGLGQLAHHVALRPHLGRAPVRERRVVHGEAVVVLGYGHDVAEAGGLEE